MGKDLLSETIAVYDQLGPKYADQIAHVQIPQLQEFINMLPRKAAVLDVGCAAGRDSAIFDSAGFNVIGIDLSRKLLELARKRVRWVGFLHMDARVLDSRFYPPVFDGIWAHAVLLNLDRTEIPNTLRGFWRALKPGGLCLVGVKEGSGEKFIGEPLVYNMKRRETYFQLSELEDLLKNAKFEIVKSYVCGDELGRSTTKWIYVFAKKQIRGT